MKLTVPLRPNLPAHTLRKPLDCELGSMVIRIPREPHESTHTGDLDYETALLTRSGIIIPHNTHGVQGELGHAPKVGI